MHSFSKTVLLLIVLALVSLNSKAKNTVLCEPKSSQKEILAIANHPLFDTAYKSAANYIPVLALRALSSTDIYRKKGKAHLVRHFFVKNLQGKLAEPYETLVLDIVVSGKGLFGRNISAQGRMNDLDVYYSNKMSFGLPKKAHMDVVASLDGCEFMKFKVESDGDKMTNAVEGTYLGRTLKYFTNWRQSLGTLAGLPYEMVVEGNGKSSVPCDKHNQDNTYCKELAKHKDIVLYHAKSQGRISGYIINGWIKETRTGHFEGEENYGPIFIKTVLDVYVE